MSDEYSVGLYLPTLSNIDAVNPFNCCVSFDNFGSSVLNTLHKIDPDVSSSWNGGFDWKTIMNRLQHLYKNKKELKEKKIRPYDEMLSVVCDKKYMFVRH